MYRVATESIYEAVLGYILRKSDRALTAAEWADALRNEPDSFYQADYTTTQVQSALRQIIKYDDHLVKTTGKLYHAVKFTGTMPAVTSDRPILRKKSVPMPVKRG